MPVHSQGKFGTNWHLQDGLTAIPQPSLEALQPGSRWRLRG